VRRFPSTLRDLRLPALAATAGLLVSGCAVALRDEPADSAATLQALAMRHHVCAVAVGAIRHGKLDTVETAAGCRPAARVTGDSVFQAASLSKPVFAYAVLKLVEQGRLELDAPVMRYLPQGYRHRRDPMQAGPSEPVTDPRLHAVTVRMALNHTSGLPNWAGGPLRFDTAPGTKWEYSGEGYVLLQRAVEAVTGQPLDRFMQAEVFEPLGMRRSAFVSTAALAPHLLPGTKANGAPRTTMPLQHPVAAFSLLTTATDYATFLAALLSDAAALERTTASAVAVDPALGLLWGLGWGIERDGERTYLWQWGNNTGYRAFAMASGATGEGFVMLTNSENGLALAEPLARKYVPGGHASFRSPILGTDIVTLACRTIGLCL
jgi:CubicO group peptidase (beta-lactamase class C family)